MNYWIPLSLPLFFSALSNEKKNWLKTLIWYSQQEFAGLIKWLGPVSSISSESCTKTKYYNDFLMKIRDIDFFFFLSPHLFLISFYLFLFSARAIILNTCFTAFFMCVCVCYVIRLIFICCKFRFIRSRGGIKDSYVAWLVLAFVFMSCEWFD